MSEAPDPLTDPELRRRNIKTALVVGGVALAILILALVRFTVWGLPEDRETFEQQEQERSATTPAEDRSND